MENKNIQEQEGQVNQTTQETPVNPENQQPANPVADKVAEVAHQIADEAGKVGASIVKGIADAGVQAAKGVGKAGVEAVKGVGKAGVEAAKVAGKVGGAAAKASAGAAAGGLLTTVGPILLKVLLVAALAGVAGVAVTAAAKYIQEANALKIGETPNVVEKIKKISELTTYTYIEEFVIKDTKMEAKEPGMLSFFHKSEVPDSTRSEIVIITRGVVRAGYDLAKIQDGDLKINNDTISVVLPATEIFDVIINPSDNDIFIEEGKWSHEEITALQVDCKNTLLNNANESGILENAHKFGKEKVENLFRTLGFNVIEIK